MTCCVICNIDDANQTGAHIFPAWMLSSAFDEKARNRDYEVIHTFHPLENALPYFGRSVQTEKIEESIGRELTEEEIKTQKNLFVVDNIWCRKCEKKLKIVEDYFLEKVDKEIMDFSNCSGETKTLSVNVYVVRLFIYSLFYRATITKLMGFELDEKSRNKLKCFLNKYIKDDLKSTVKFLENCNTKNELLNYPIRCIKMEKEEGRTSNFVYLHKKYNKPYSFIINNYILQFYSKENHIRSTPNSFFGITDILSKMSNLINFNEFDFHIGMIDIEQWYVIKSKFIKFHFLQKNQNFILIYKKKFKDKFGVYPNEIQVQKLLKLLIENNLKSGVTFTVEKILEAMNKSLVQ